MASSSSSAAPAANAFQEDIAPLPLIRCPRCNSGVTALYISHTDKNPGRHFYKCQFHGTPLCNFWKWENKYTEYIMARWGHMFIPTPPNGAQDEHKALLLQNQEELKNIKIILIVIGLAVLTVMALKF